MIHILGNVGSRPRRALAIFTGAAILASLVAAIVFFLRYYANDWSVAGTSFSNWVVVICASILAWIPASLLRKILLEIIRLLYKIYDPSNQRRGKTKVLFKSMRWHTTFLIWTISEFLVISLVFQWNPFPLDNDAGDIHDNATLALINVIFVVAALLLVVKQHFLVTKVKLAKRTEYVESKAREALSWERALNVITSDLNPAIFRKKNVPTGIVLLMFAVFYQGIMSQRIPFSFRPFSDLNPSPTTQIDRLRYEDVSLSKKAAVDAAAEGHFSVAQLFMGAPLRRRGYPANNANDATRVHIEVDEVGGPPHHNTSIHTPTARRATAALHVDPNDTSGGGSEAPHRKYGTSVVPFETGAAPPGTPDTVPQNHSGTQAVGSSRILTDEDVDGNDDAADIYNELEHLRTHYISCCNEQVVIGTKADGRKLAALLILLLMETEKKTDATTAKENREQLGLRVVRDKKLQADDADSQTPDYESRTHCDTDDVAPPVEGEDDDDDDADVDDDDEENTAPVPPPKSAGTPTQLHSSESISVEFLMRHCQHDKDVASLVKDVLGCVSEVSKSRLKSGIEVVRKHRQHLRQSLEDLDSTVKAVDTFLAVFIGIVIMLLLLIIFSQGDFAEVTVTTSTSIFALSFIFAETAKNLFNSFVFLFLRHPFDVGDRVHIGSNSSDPYYVLKMELLTTTFTMWSGHVVTIPNHVLYASTIFNVARAGPMSDPLELLVRRQTTLHQLRQLEADFNAFICDHPDDYLPTSRMFLREYRSGNSILIVYFLDYTTNWQLAQHIYRKQAAMYSIHASLEKLAIFEQQAQLPVEVSSAGARRASLIATDEGLHPVPRDPEQAVRTTEVTV